MKIIFLFLVTVFAAAISNAQQLDQHLWKHRLILIVYKSEQNTDRTNQIKWLQEASADFKERKIKVYQITPSSILEGLQQAAGRIKDYQNHYEKYTDGKVDFELLLIGLDGGIKLRSTSAEKAEYLFGIIDAMPMRKAEIDQSQGKKN